MLDPQLIFLDHGHSYDRQRGILNSCSNGGLFSNFYHTTWSLVDLKNQGMAPTEIRFQSGFRMFRGTETKDLYPVLFSIDLDALDAWARADLPWIPRFDHHGVYELYPDPLVAMLMEAYFQPSDRVKTLTAALMRKYQLEPATFICVYFRGTDKGNEVKLPNFRSMMDQAIELSRASRLDRILFQTDDSDIQETIRREHPSVITIDELPTSQGSQGFHFENQANNFIEPTEFSVRLCAAVQVMAQARHLIVPSSNLSGWLYQVRRNRLGFFQYDKSGKPVTGAYKGLFTIKNALRKARARLNRSAIYYV